MRFTIMIIKASTKKLEGLEIPGGDIVTNSQILLCAGHSPISIVGSCMSSSGIIYLSISIVAETQLTTFVLFVVMVLICCSCAICSCFQCCLPVFQNCNLGLKVDLYYLLICFSLSSIDLFWLLVEISKISFFLRTLGTDSVNYRGTKTWQCED